MSTYQIRRCQLICFHSLLIATAFQGVTPDGSGMASLNSLRVLCPALVRSNTLRSDDCLPDEVCGPSTPELDLALRSNARSKARALPACVSSFTHAPTTHLFAGRPVNRETNSTRIGDLIYTLCRLNC
jgi:hypothetical protein